MSSPAPGTVEYYKAQVEASKRAAQARQNIQVRAGETSVSPEKVDPVTGEHYVEVSKPTVTIPSSEVTRRSYDAMKALGGNGGKPITAEAIEQKRTEQIAAEVAQKGGVEIRQGIYQEGQAAGYKAYQQNRQAQDDFYNKPIFGSKTAAQAQMEVQRARNRETPRYSNSYQVNIEDRISDGPFAYRRDIGGGGDGQTSTEEARLAVERARGNPIDEAFTAAKDKVENLAGPIVYSVVDLFGGRKIPRTTYDKNGNVIRREGQPPKPKPEVESGVYTALNAGKSSSAKGGFVLVNPASIRALGGVGEEIKENPGGAVGSLAVTAATFFAPSIAPKAASAVIQTAKTAKTSSKVAQIVQQAARETKQGAAAVRAVKIMDDGSVIALREGPAGFVKEPISIPSVGLTKAVARVDIPGANMAIPIPKIAKTRTTAQKVVRPKNYIVEDKEGKDIGFVNAETGEVYFYKGETMTTAEKQAALEGGALRTAAEDTVDMFQVSRPEAAQVGNIVRIEQGAVSRSPVILGPGGSIDPLKGPARLTGAPTAAELMGANTGTARPEPLGTVVRYKADKLAKTAADTAKRERQIAEANLALEGVRRKESVKPFDFSIKKTKPGKTSRAPLETVNEFSFDRELSATGKAVIKIAADNAKAATKAGSKPITPIFTLRRNNGESKEWLGHGGATGAERVKNKENTEIIPDEAVLIAYPPGSRQDAQTKPETATAPRVQLGTTSKQENHTNTRVNLFTSERTETKRNVKTVSDTTTRQDAGFSLKIQTTPQQTTQQQPMQTPFTGETTKQTTRQDTKQATRQTPFQTTRQVQRQRTTRIITPKIANLPRVKPGSHKSSGYFGPTSGKHLGVVNIAARAFDIKKGSGEGPKLDLSKALGLKPSKKKKKGKRIF